MGRRTPTWILYPGERGEFGGRADAETAEEAFELIVAGHRAGVAVDRQDELEARIRGAHGPGDLVRATRADRPVA